MNFWNIKIFEYLNSWAGNSVSSDRAIVFFASVLPFIFILGVIIFLWIHSENHKKRIREIFFVFIVALIAWLVAVCIKNVIHAPRPYAILDGVKKLFSPDDIFSFPSGHATFFSALAMALYLRHKKVGIIFFVGALLIGLARVIGGIHFPIDIFGGYVLGIGIVLLVDYFFKKG